MFAGSASDGINKPKKAAVFLRRLFVWPCKAGFGMILIWEKIHPFIRRIVVVCTGHPVDMRCHTGLFAYQDRTHIDPQLNSVEILFRHIALLPKKSKEKDRSLDGAA